MTRILLSETEDYDALVELFIRNELEFTEEEPVPTDLVKCWKATHGGDLSKGVKQAAKSEQAALVGGAVLAKREGEYILDGIAVDPLYRKLRLGELLLRKVTDEVKARGGKQLFLVARAPEFFRKHGFVTVPRQEAPNFFECLTCPQYGVSCHPEVMRLNTE